MDQPKKFNQTILFFLNSAFTGVLYVAMLYFGDSLLHAQYYLSVTIAYAVSMIYYFITNKKAVFKTDSDTKRTSREAIGFTILLVVNYIISIAIVGIVWHFTKEIYLGSLLAGAITVTLTYFVFNRIIFKTKS